jgi:glucose/arabinose dehydrogenase
MKLHRSIAAAVTLLASFALANSVASGQAADDANPACAPSAYAADTYFPEPAFKGQTRAPAPTSSTPFNVEVITNQLNEPWSLAFLPDGRMLVTETAGVMKIVRPDGAVSAPLAGVPPVERVALGGLHDVALDPQFETNRILYFNHVTRGDTGAVGRVMRARLTESGDALEDVTAIHEGGTMRRLAFAPDGALLVTSGDTAGPEPQALDHYDGKVLRINPDGSIPNDNPFIGVEGAHPELFAIGFRDPEGATINPRTGELWTIENGPRGGDELNIVRAGRNYGFSEISYGREYSGDLINGGLTAREGLEQPVYFWTPSIAPSGILFYTGELFPDWRGDLFIGALAGKRLIHLKLEGERVVSEEVLLADRCVRIRDVRQGPDEAIYLLTDETKGELLRLTPRS